jgi:hypothetical protein
MATRVNKLNLQAIVDRLNIITKSPLTPYRTVNGHNVVNAGCFLLSSAYGGYALCRMTEGGGESDIFNQGHMPARQLADLMWAFIRGYEMGASK